jgi:dolichyl-diphosphooligosaccharide---protein glycosyltransferase
MIPLHALTLTLMGRYSSRLYVAYSSWYAIGTLASMQVPFVGFQPVKTSEHMAALGLYSHIQLCTLLISIRRSRFRSPADCGILRGCALSCLLPAVPKTVVQWCYCLRSPRSPCVHSINIQRLDCSLDWSFLLPLGHRICQKVVPFFLLPPRPLTNKQPRYIPIIASVSEHQPTAWPAFFMDLNFLIFLFPAGVFLCFRDLRDEHVFVIIYAVVASYFAGVMVRLMLTLTPVVCVTSAVALSSLLDTYIDATVPDTPVGDSKSDAASGTNGPTTPSQSSKKAKKSAAAQPSPSGQLFTPATPSFKDAKSRGKKGIYSPDTRLVVVFNAFLMLSFFVAHCTWVTSNAYSSPSVVLASHNSDGSQHIIDDFREAYYWLRQNTPETAVVMSWWDYGYQIAGMADRPTLVDNNTWNNS